MREERGEKSSREQREEQKRFNRNDIIYNNICIYIYINMLGRLWWTYMFFIVSEVLMKMVKGIRIQVKGVRRVKGVRLVSTFETLAGL